MPTIQRTVTFNSRFRKNRLIQPSGNYKVQLPYPIKTTINMDIESAIIPPSYFAIDANLGNNFFLIVCITGITIFTFQVVIPSGNYTPQSFVDHLNNATFVTDWDVQDVIAGTIFPRNPSVGPPDDIGQRILAKLDPASGRIIIYVNEDFTTPLPTAAITALNLDFTSPLTTEPDTLGVMPPTSTNVPLQLGLGWMMGYRNAFYTESLAYVGESIADLHGSPYFYILVNDFMSSTSNENIGALADSYLDANILAKVNVSDLTEANGKK